MAIFIGPRELALLLAVVAVVLGIWLLKRLLSGR
jgi:hypothetical protein